MSTLISGGLAGAVLAHEGVDFAGEEAEADFAEGADAGERFADALRGTDVRAMGHCAGWPMLLLRCVGLLARPMPGVRPAVTFFCLARRKSPKEEALNAIRTGTKTALARSGQELPRSELLGRRLITSEGSDLGCLSRG